MNKKTALKIAPKDGGNLVSIEAYDNTSHGYRKEANQRPETRFGAYLTIAMLVFLLILFVGLYELAVETWTRLK